ncbi:FPL domain-containing protein [Plasmodiophora brassicae]
MWPFTWSSRKPREKYSLENLKYLYEELLSYPQIDDYNKETVVEILRSIAELMIWGDQHNDNVFYFFCEKNILSRFITILSQSRDRQVTVQILQTLSIMIQNFSRQTSMYYLLSNNHINDLIMIRFDFGDEEVIAYYISFLKTLSLKLNRNTLQFFFNQAEGRFPLYSQAIQFFHHQEAMVRIAVRTLTLNVYKVDDPGLRQFILDKSAVPYFSNLVWFIRDQLGELDVLLRQSVPDQHVMTRVLDVLIDQFHYIMDILRLDICALSQVLVDQLLSHLIIPVLIASIGSRDTPNPSLISKRLALFTLFQIFLVFTDRCLINSVVTCLLHLSPPAICEQIISCPPEQFPLMNAGSSLTNILYTHIVSHDNDVGSRPISEAVDKNRARAGLIDSLSDPDLCTLAAATLLALLRNPELDTSLIVEVRMCPQRTLKRRRLLDALLSSPASTSGVSDQHASDNGASQLPQATDATNDRSQGVSFETTEYPSDVVEAIFRSLSQGSIERTAVMILTHLLIELAHVERGGLNDSHTKNLLELLSQSEQAVRDTQEYHDLADETRNASNSVLSKGNPFIGAFEAAYNADSSVALSLAALAEPGALLLGLSGNSPTLADKIAKVVALHRCCVSLSGTFTMQPGPFKLQPSKPEPGDLGTGSRTGCLVRYGDRFQEQQRFLVHHPSFFVLTKPSATCEPCLYVPVHRLDISIDCHDPSVLDLLAHCHEQPDSDWPRPTCPPGQPLRIRLRFESVDSAQTSCIQLVESRSRARARFREHVDIYLHSHTTV